MAENADPRRATTLGFAHRPPNVLVSRSSLAANYAGQQPSSSTSFDQKSYCSVGELSADMRSIDRVFNEGESSLTMPHVATADCDLQTAQLRSMLESRDAQALRNSQLEIARLSNVLEEEMEKWANQKQKLEEEVRRLKQAEKSFASCILSPPTSTSARKSLLQSESDRYVIGLTGVLLNDATRHFKTMGATIVDADDISLRISAKGTSLYNEFILEFGTSVLDRQTAEIRREGLDAKRMAKFDRRMGAAVGSESLRQIDNAASRVVVFRASRLFDTTVSCNAVVVVAASLETQVARMMAENPGMSSLTAGRRVEVQQVAAASPSTLKPTFVLNCSDESISLLAQTARIWQMIPSSLRQPTITPRVVARLVAVDATLPNCELADGADVSFGRAESCSVQIADLTVSHEQCRIFCAEQKVWIDDLSSHGTFVNRAKIGRGLRVQLNHGDRIFLSKSGLKRNECHFVVHLLDKAETRTVMFDGGLVHSKVLPSETPKWIEKKSHAQPETIFWLNVRTGEVVSTKPEE